MLKLSPIFLTGCILPQLPNLPAAPRNHDAQLAAAMKIVVDCGDNDPTEAQPWDQIEARTASAVAVSERHAVTSYHAISCPLTPQIHGRLSDGRDVVLVVTREDDAADWARLEIWGAGNFDLGVAPPVLTRPQPGDAVFATVRRYNWTSVQGAWTGGNIAAGMTTQPGDSGAGVYLNGALVGVVSEGNGHSTVVTPALSEWLRF